MPNPVPRAVLLSALLVCAIGAGGGNASPVRHSLPPVHLRDSNLFERLSAARDVAINRLDGEWSPACDSMVRISGSPLDCFTIAGEVPLRSREAVPQLVRLLEPCVWVRSKGWIAPECPTLGFTLRGDSMEATLLVSLRAMKATIFLPGEGAMGTSLPDSAYSRLAWCLWRIDPHHAELQKPMESERHRLGFEGDTGPPDDDQWGTDVLPDPPGVGEFVYYDDPPTPLSIVQPNYPEMARDGKIQGRVILHVLVGTDGRVKKIKVIRSITHLDQAAKDAVRQWIFKPALRNGEAVAVWVEVPVEFHF